MLYIQITTFFGSRCKFKMSCLRPNYCAARKVWFQQFFPPQHPFYLGGGYFHPRCVPVPRARGASGSQGEEAPLRCAATKAGCAGAARPTGITLSHCTGLPFCKLKPTPLCTPSRLVQAACEVPGRRRQRGKVLVCPCRRVQLQAPKARQLHPSSTSPSWGAGPSQHGARCPQRWLLPTPVPGL